MEITDLEKLGFTRNEVKVYIALLKLGQTTIGKILKETKLFAPRIYEALERLINKGLVSSLVLNKKKYFQAVDPSRILLLIKERENVAKNLIPLLKSIKSDKEESPKIEVFIGKEGIKTISEGELTAKDISVLWASPQFQERFEYYRPAFHKRRVEKKIYMKVIYDEKYRDYSKDLKRMPYSKVRYFPYSLPLTVILYNDIIVIVFWSKDLIAIRLKGKEFVNEVFKSFDMLWKLAKK